MTESLENSLEKSKQNLNRGQRGNQWSAGAPQRMPVGPIHIDVDEERGSVLHKRLWETCPESVAVAGAAGSQAASESLDVLPQTSPP